MAKLAVFVAILAFASAVPLDNRASVLPSLDASGVASINDGAAISNLPSVVSPGISVLPGVIDDSNQIVEIEVVHDATPCTACFQYMSQLIQELTNSVGVIPIEIVEDGEKTPIEIVAEEEEAVAIPGDVADSETEDAVALPGETSDSETEDAVALPGETSDSETEDAVALPGDVADSETEDAVALPGDNFEGIQETPVALPGELPGAVVIPEIAVEPETRPVEIDLGSLQRPAEIKDIIF